MEKFRNLTKNIFFKIFLSFLGLSFIMFGIGDFIMGSTTSWVAKVDGKKISHSDFLRTVDQNREFIYRVNPSEQTLQYLNSEQFKQDTLKNMINKLIIEALSNDFGLIPDKRLILKDIATHPQFVNSEGQFNRVAFINYLKINGLSEEKFVENVGRETVSQIVVNSLIYNPLPNTKLARELYAQKEEKRVADVIILKAENLPKIAAPTKEELEQFFKNNQQQFTTPELRKVSYVEFNEADFAAKNISVSKEEILAAYNENPIFQKPASKDFYHVVFDDEKSAKNFLKALEEEKAKAVDVEKAFIDLAAKLQKRKKEDILMANLSENDLLAEIRKDVSNLKIGNYSSILKSSLGWHIFYLLKENPASKYPLTDKLSAEIEKSLLAEKKEQFLAKKMEEIEDQTLLSKSLKEFAKKFNFKIKETEKFDEKGLTISQKDVSKQVALDDFVKNSFSVGSQEISPLFYSKSNKKYFVLFVDKIEESRSKSLDEVSTVVAEMFNTVKKQEKLQELANKIYAELQKSGNVDSIVEKNNLKLVKNQVFSRAYKVNIEGEEINYANDFTKDLFAAKIGEATAPRVVSNQEVNIVILKEIISGKVDEAKLKSFEQQLASDFKNNIINNFDQYLEKKYPVKINEKIFNQENS